MKQNWQIDPVPPPESSASGMDGFVSLALLAFAIVGPVIYFGVELAALERIVVGWYGTVENWLLPIRDWVRWVFVEAMAASPYANFWSDISIGNDDFAPPRAGVPRRQ